MRKLFTIVCVLLAMAGLHAQYLLQENFDGGVFPSGWTAIDGDGDGFNWVMSTDFDGVIYAHNASAGCILSQSYDRNTSSRLRPDNWLITPAIALPSNATLTYWVCAQDASYPAEHYAVYAATSADTTALLQNILLEETLDANGGPRTEGAWKQKTVDLSAFTGQTIYLAFRHFNCYDQFYLKMDDIAVFAQPTSPVITANTPSVTFSNVVAGSEATTQISVVGYVLEEGITATTEAPFLVSADGTSFAATATLPAAGGTLYVRFAPETPGDHAGEITLSSAGAENLTVAAVGTAIDCSVFPIYENFDNGRSLCWTVINNGNAQNNPYVAAWPGEIFLMFCSFYPSDDYNQYLISPPISYTDGEMAFAFDYKSHDYYDESFRVGYSTTTSEPSAFTWIDDITTSDNENWAHASYTIPQGARHVAINYYSNMLALYVDNLAVTFPTQVSDVAAERVRIFPNPATSTLNVEASGMNEVSVVNVLGQTVYSGHMSGTTRINVSNWEDGVYFVRLSGEKGSITQKFVKK